MKHVKLFEQFISEGVNDPGILKAFFMAGGPGSGKSYVATELFDFPKGAISSVSYATGLKLVNNDNSFEKQIKDAGYDIGKLADYAKDPETWSKVMDIRNKAKGTTKRMQDNYIGGRLGQVIDGTGKDPEKIANQAKELKKLGYDVAMIFVNTDVETAVKRDAARERTIGAEEATKYWKLVQRNIGKFQTMFGKKNFLVVDNSEGKDYKSETLRAYRDATKFTQAPVDNSKAKKWIKSEKSKK